MITDPSFDPGTGANNPIFTFSIQPDNKILIGGDFTTFDNTPRNRIARLNADGSLDTSFDPGSGANDWVFAFSIQPDGKILIAGNFTTVDNTPRNHIARLNADGSLDVSFDPGSGTENLVSTLALQPDGKILIGGNFATFNGIPRNNIVRLNADGSLDASFDPGSGTDYPVNSLFPLPDGKILIGGDFTSFNGIPRNNVARLNADGSLDASFDAGAGTDNLVFTLVLQPDGKILTGGNFTTFNGTPRNGIARLNADGSLDASFDPGSGTDDLVFSIGLQPDDKILIGGTFTTFNGTPRNNIARLNADGSLDASFDPGSGADFTVFTLGTQLDGTILIVGVFITFNETSRNRIARLTFTATVTPSISGGNGTISPITVQSVAVGTPVAFTLTPHPGYVVDYVDGTCTGSLSGNVFIATAADCTVVGHFRPSGAPPTVQPVPLLGPWALGSLIVLLGLFGGLKRRL